MEIRFKKGSRIKSKPEIVHAELERVREIGDGDLSLQVLVDESKPKDAALHGEFIWTNTTAANHWRLYQARQVTQSLEVVHEKGPPTRAYESVRVVEAEVNKPVKIRHVFRTIDDVMANPDTRDELLAQAFREGAAFRKRFHGLQELAKVFAALDDVLLKVKLKKA
jgi:hypothetical protein